jgi:hypothetical protein
MEVQEKKVENLAKELGISTKDKTTHELIEAIQEKDADKLKALRSDDFFLPIGKGGFGPGGHHGKGKHHEGGKQFGPGAPSAAEGQPQLNDESPVETGDEI